MMSSLSVCHLQACVVLKERIGGCAKWMVTAAFILYLVSCCLQLFVPLVLEQVV